MMLRRLLLLALVLLASACSPTRPDLTRLYQNADDNPAQPPVIIIHGLAGSTLVDAKTGKQFWPGSLGTLAFSNFSDLRQMSAEDREGEGLVPGTLMYDVVGVDFYGELLRTLETVGRFKRSTPGEAAGGERRRYYVLLYDWRKDNLIAVRKLHAMIEQIRKDYDDPNLRVDIIAHSNGGTITNYYLRYGPNDVPPTGPMPTWDEGDRRIRRVVMLGTPMLGAVTSLERLVYGTRLALRTVPVEVMTTFATPFQALPHPKTTPILDTQGRPVRIDIYDPAQWRAHQWGVYSPEVEARVRDAGGDASAGERAVARMHEVFEANLQRAARLQWALSEPLPPRLDVRIAAFGGDCEPTPGHAIMLDEADGGRLVFRPAQAATVRGKQAGGYSRGQFDSLMTEPGDGLVPRSSQTARRPPGVDADSDGFHMLPVQGSFFLCESHGRLTHNPYFQDNLLYFLLSR
jgi:pimeloyl-ACP methyl ester carboxylesterase